MSLPTSADVAANVAPQPQQIAALREAAADYVHRATGMSLDGSEESLAIIDHYIERIREKTGPAAPKLEVLRLVAAALGVYLGELCISRFGGSWLLIDKPAEADDEPEAVLQRWRVELIAAPLVIDPLGLAATALLPDGAIDSDDDDFGFTLLPAHKDLYGPLHAALSRMAPVDSGYYYSLTGRFETLSYLVELVMELRHQQEEASTANDDATEAAAPEPPPRQ